jgi:3-phosphoshikimate 1-carboxyvinyltransferase
MGAEIEALPDGLRVSGPQRLRGAVMSSHGDHRLAMLFGVAGALADGRTVVRKAESVAVSYQGFWDDLDRLCGA